MECKLPFCACKHILPHPRVFCVKTALKGREFRGKCGEMQGGREAQAITPSVPFDDSSLLYRAPAKILRSKRFVGRGAASIGAKPRVKQAACEICSAATRRQGNKELQILGGDGVGDAEAVGGGRGDAARVPAALAAGIHARNALRLEIFAAQDADGRARARFDAR